MSIFVQNIFKTHSDYYIVEYKRII